MVRGAARGVIAAMAMSGLRRATTALDLVGATPPEAIPHRVAPGVLYRIPVERRPALVEAVHWSYGAVGGLLFGTLPRGLRRRPWAGPAYGVLFWALFQVGVGPVLGLRGGRSRAREQLAVLGDHLLYGVVVASSPWPHRD